MRTVAVVLVVILVWTAGCTLPWPDCTDGPWESLWISDGAYGELAASSSEYEKRRGLPHDPEGAGLLLDATDLPSIRNDVDAGSMWLREVGWDVEGFHDYKTAKERDVLTYRLIEEDGEVRPAMLGRFAHSRDPDAIREAAYEFMVRLTGRPASELGNDVERFMASRETDAVYKHYIGDSDRSLSYYILPDLEAPALEAWLVETHRRIGLDDTPQHLLMDDEPWWFIFEGSFIHFAGESDGHEWKLLVDLDRVYFGTDEAVSKSRHIALRDAIWDEHGLTARPAPDGAEYDRSCRHQLDLSS